MAFPSYFPRLKSPRQAKVHQDSLTAVKQPMSRGIKNGKKNSDKKLKFKIG
jgi:hypothetical protein